MLQITFGGYLVYFAQAYRIFADPREYCFRHLDSVYLEAYNSPRVLNESILEVRCTAYAPLDLQVIWFPRGYTGSRPVAVHACLGSSFYASVCFFESVQAVSVSLRRPNELN